MKVSCLPVSLFGDFLSGDMDLGDWLDAAGSIGYDGIDISIMMIKNHTASYLDIIKKKISKSNIPVVMATTYPDFTHPDARQREREFDYLKRDIALCDELSIKYLRVLAGQAHPGVTRDEGIKNAVYNLRHIAEYAKKYSDNVTLLYENHAKPGAWPYVDFSYPLDIFYDVLEGIKDTGIRLNFDIGNIVSLGEDPLKVLEKVFDSVETVHISDMAENAQFSPVLIGTGVAPIKEVLSFLKAGGFDGWYCIEEASGNGIKGIEDAYKYLTSTYEQI